MPLPFLRWKIGDVRITRLVEFEQLSAAELLPNATPETLTPHREWLSSNSIDTTGIVVAIQSFVIESQGQRIIVDTCIGNDKERAQPELSGLHTKFLPNMEEAGFPRSSIDIVLCTHLHIDHVGWNTILTDEVWIPTFPNARYLIGLTEWNQARQLAEADTAQLIRDSIQPVFDRGLIDLVESTHPITDEVFLQATPGHTAGHMSVWIRSHGDEAVISGDVFHSPVQIAEPGWCARNDFDPIAAERSRRTLIQECLAGDTLLLGTHFTSPTAGRIAQYQDRDILKAEPITR